MIKLLKIWWTENVQVYVELCKQFIFRDYAMNPTNSNKLNSEFLCKTNSKKKKFFAYSDTL